MIVGFGMMVVMQFMTIRSMRAMQKTLSDVPDKGMRGEFNSLITEMRELLSDVPDKGMRDEFLSLINAMQQALSQVPRQGMRGDS